MAQPITDAAAATMINNTISYFDFKKAQAYYELTNWEIQNHENDTIKIPSVVQLRKLAYELLTETFKQACSAYSPQGVFHRDMQGGGLFVQWTMATDGNIGCYLMFAPCSSREFTHKEV